ncbi:UDP binding domain-containing protein, partial [Clavibacter michiganensis]|uniref:UDP binding domain-containing protein n=1 Tax=Clavibacter michiganensis TaxID=28447 RepID=UPI00292E57F0
MTDPAAPASDDHSPAAEGAAPPAAAPPAATPAAAAPPATYVDTWQEAARDADAVMVLTEWKQYRAIDPAELKAIVTTP